jgi:type IV pilus assembly protein PilM
LNEQDAEAGKSQLDVRGLLPNSGIDDTPPLRVIQPHVDDLLREIRRSMNYFQSQQTESTDGRKIEKILLSGGGAKLPGLDSYFAHRLEVAVETAGLFSNSRILPPSSDVDTGTEFVVAGGLSLRTFGKVA